MRLEGSGLFPFLPPTLFLLCAALGFLFFERGGSRLLFLSAPFLLCAALGFLSVALGLRRFGGGLALRRRAPALCFERGRLLLLVALALFFRSPALGLLRLQRGRLLGVFGLLCGLLGARRCGHRAAPSLVASALRVANASLRFESGQEPPFLAPPAFVFAGAFRPEQERTEHTGQQRPSDDE